MSDPNQWAPEAWLTCFNMLQALINKDLQSGTPKLLQVFYEYAGSQRAFAVAVAQYCKAHMCVGALVTCMRHEIASCVSELLFRQDTLLVCTLREIIADDVRVWLHAYVLGGIDKMSKATIALLSAEKPSDKQTKLCCIVFSQILDVMLSSHLPSLVVDVFSTIVRYLIELKALSARSARMLVLSNLLMLRAVVPALWVELKGTRHTFVRLQKMLLSVSLSAPPVNMPEDILVQVERYQKHLRHWARRELTSSDSSPEEEEESTPDTKEAAAVVLPADIGLWTVANVQSWLRTENLGSQQHAFNYNGIDGQALLELECDDLIEMTLSRVECFHFMTAVNRLCARNGIERRFKPALLKTLV